MNELASNQPEPALICRSGMIKLGVTVRSDEIAGYSHKNGSIVVRFSGLVERTVNELKVNLVEFAYFCVISSRVLARTCFLATGIILRCAFIRK